MIIKVEGGLEPLGPIGVYAYGRMYNIPPDICPLNLTLTVI